MSFYPVAVESKEIVPLDKVKAAEKVIECMDAGKSKQASVGIVLDGSNDIASFDAVWDEVLAEKAKLQAVKVGVKDADYKIELDKVATYADTVKWVTETKKALGVSSLADIKPTALGGEVEEEVIIKK